MWSTLRRKERSVASVSQAASESIASASAADAKKEVDDDDASDDADDAVGESSPSPAGYMDFDRYAEFVRNAERDHEVSAMDAFEVALSK